MLAKVWTGPTIVRQVAARMREAGLTVETEGTEHVYFRTDAANEQEAQDEFRDAMVRKHGSTSGLRATSAGAERLRVEDDPVAESLAASSNPGGLDALKQRIADALGWKRSDVDGFSLATVRDLLRQNHPKLAAEVGEVVDQGGHIKVPVAPRFRRRS